jgi:hypothetical protein
MLDSVKDRYDEIHVSPDWAIYDQYCSERGQDYVQFIRYFFGKLFSEKPYVLTDDQSYEMISALHTGGFKLVKPDIRKYFKDHRTQLVPYIVITTKVRGTPKYLYDNLEDLFLEALTKISKKYLLVILGERSVGMNKEYKIHGSNIIYSIYSSIRFLPNCMDLSGYSELGIKSPSEAIFEGDLNLMAHSVATIAIGCGGNFCLASAIANTVAYSIHGDGELVLNALYRDKEDPTVSVDIDPVKFCERIISL